MAAPTVLTLQASGVVPALLTAPEAARYLATTERHLRRLRDRRVLPVVHIGGKVRYRRSDLDALIELSLER